MFLDQLSSFSFTLPPYMGYSTGELGCQEQIILRKNNPPEEQDAYCFLVFFAVVFFFVAGFFLVAVAFFLGAGFFLAATFLVDALAVAFFAVVFLAAGFFLVAVAFFLATGFFFGAAGFFAGAAFLAFGLAVIAFFASAESLYEALTLTSSPSATPLARAALMTCFLTSFCRGVGGRYHV